jgi:hypothetical protein
VNGTWLALTPEQFCEAQAAASELVPLTHTAPGRREFEPLLDAEDAAAQLGVTPRLLEDYVRAGIAPHYRLGRFVRFRPSELTRHFAVEGAAPTDSQSVRSIRRLARQ